MNFKPLELKKAFKSCTTTAAEYKPDFGIISQNSTQTATKWILKQSPKREPHYHIKQKKQTLSEQLS